MIDHLGFTVSDYPRAKTFYAAALAPLDYVLVMEFGMAAGFGARGKPDLWFSAGEKTAPPIHIAIRAKDRKTVDAFYAAAIEAGGRDNGPPGIRAHYHPDYYGAFVLDPDGNNLEAVCHEAE
ncbi:MAG: VOC family protein [Alphaproteobacteria bacterium]|nr:VOC family protein [Alphaproteobacteria bacterium]